MDEQAKPETEFMSIKVAKKIRHNLNHTGKNGLSPDEEAAKGFYAKYVKIFL